jgi:peptidoglycan/xylan/chitin deacetylase (PgdA/CDA1 family)
MLIKHSIKHAAGLVAAAGSLWNGRAVSGTCVLMYHRVTQAGVFDLSVDNWNVTPARLEKQLRWLAAHADCVSLGKVLQRRSAGVQAKPAVAVTFDDAFANFRHEALPLLERYGIPATVFVPTRYVGSQEPYPFDCWGRRNRSRVPAMTWRPITWPELGECLKSGLVSVGSHSHSHINALNAKDEQLQEEAMLSREALRSRLGPDHLSFYAYPYGATRLGQVTPAYMDAVRNAGYRMAFTTDLGLAQPETSPFQIPRVEVHALDSPSILRGKVSGHLWAQGLCDRLRQPLRHSA